MDNGEIGCVDEGNRSLQRGLTVLDYVWERRREGVRVVELVRSCALERATVYRLLSTLISTGYVARRGRFLYVPGPRFDELSFKGPVDSLAEKLRPVLKRISELTGDAAFAIVREGSQSHCIARHIGTHPLQVVVVQVGRRQPLGVGAAGLALLASLPEGDASAIIEANASALSGYGGMTPERLQILVKATRTRGWAVVGNHVVSDTLGVGLAIPSPTGTPEAAISVAAPIQRMGLQRQNFIEKTIRDAFTKLLPLGL